MVVSAKTEEKRNDCKGRGSRMCFSVPVGISSRSAHEVLWWVVMPNTGAGVKPLDVNREEEAMKH